MKPFDKHDNHGKPEHEHTQDKGVLERIKGKLKNYWKNMYCSGKCKKMPRGSYGIIRSMSWAHGEEWRKNHAKSLNKKK